MLSAVSGYLEFLSRGASCSTNLHRLERSGGVVYLEPRRGLPENTGSDVSTIGMETKLCRKCGAVNNADAEKCDCGYSFVHDMGGGSEASSAEELLADLLGGRTLNVKALAIACAIFWGVAVFLLTWWIILFEGSTGETLLIDKIYRGYTVSPLGSVIGLVWGVVDGAITGAVVAWLYNVITLKLTASRMRG